MQIGRDHQPCMYDFFHAHLSLYYSSLAKMDQTKRANVAQLRLQSARLMSLTVTSLKLYRRQQNGERQDFPSGEPIQPVSL